MDNEISRLSDCVSILQMHCRVVDDISGVYRASMWKQRGILALTALTAGGATAAAVTLAMPMQAVAGAATLGLLSVSALAALQHRMRQELSRELVSPERVEATFRKMYARRIADRDEYVKSLWVRVRDHLRIGLTASDLGALGRVTSSEMHMLERILDEDAPRLRRLSAPSFNKG